MTETVEKHKNLKIVVDALSVILILYLVVISIISHWYILNGSEAIFPIYPIQPLLILFLSNLSILATVRLKRRYGDILTYRAAKDQHKLKKIFDILSVVFLCCLVTSTLAATYYPQVLGTPETPSIFARFVFLDIFLSIFSIVWFILRYLEIKGFPYINNQRYQSLLVSIPLLVFVLWRLHEIHHNL